MWPPNFDFKWNRPQLHLLLGGALALLLPVLAVLQYRWISDLSLSEKERLERKLKESVSLFSREFNSELLRINTFLLAPIVTSEDGEDYGPRYRRWATNNNQLRIVKAIYRTSGGERATDKLETYNAEADSWQQIAWPQTLLKMKDQAEWRPPPAEPPPGPRPPGPGRGPRDWFESGVVAATAPRLIVETDPDLGSAIWSNAILQGWTIVELDRDYLRREYFPELTGRHFGEDYELRIANRNNTKNVIFQTTAAADNEEFGYADASGSLFDIRPENPGRFGPRPAQFRGLPPDGQPPPEPRGRWLISVRHRAGSIDQAAGTVKNRNTAISLAILLLMGGTMALLLAATRQSQRMAHQQMEFVASVSHELRTPLTVIRSAGDNLTDGLVTSEGQVRRYGALIRNEGRRLSEMVEQIMSFAGLEKGKTQFEFTSVDVNALIQRAVASCDATLKERGCRVEINAPDALPHVLADPNSLAHCLQNLLTNAAKYANESGWIGVTARTSESSKGPQLEISVEDRGQGIRPEDLPHIFEPFYRGKRAIEDQIHGTGLGLSLVKRIMEAHSGAIDVHSVPGQGSTFTLRLPAAQVS